MPSDSLTTIGDDIAPGSSVIEVHVRELSQLFNSMDPSPFLDKDLDVDAEEFIVSWARELPDDKPLALMVHLDRAAVVPNEGRLLGEAVHSYFRHRAELTERRLRDLFRRGRKSLFIGLLFLTGSILLGRWVEYLFSGRSISEIVREGLVIGGWVAMWRPMEIFLYDWWPIRNERRIYDRLSSAAVRINCTGRSDATRPRPDLPANIAPSPG
ncbi:MAG TPA: hypothetical protein VH518_17080 [Tepidisphaeraceae bacterium]|jgi:hypothetical protein